MEEKKYETDDIRILKTPEERKVTGETGGDESTKGVFSALRVSGEEEIGSVEEATQQTIAKYYSMVFRKKRISQTITSRDNKQLCINERINDRVEIDK